MLRNDPWLTSIRQTPKYQPLLDVAVSNAQNTRTKYQRVPTTGSATL
jgi:hypothetical protein